MDMMRTAASWLNNQRSQYLSETISYIQDDTTLSVSACRGRTLFRAENDYGVTIRIHSTDFIVSTADFCITPHKGDEIVCAGKRYEVLAPNNEPVYRWAGNGNEAIRIHTKEIGDAT